VDGRASHTGFAAKRRAGFKKVLADRCKFIALLICLSVQGLWYHIDRFVSLFVSWLVAYSVATKCDTSLMFDKKLLSNKITRISWNKKSVLGS
jgi:F0F1-type ATP synthase assembly protein I